MDNPHGKEELLKISIQRYSDLSDAEKENVPDNGRGKECASYLRVEHNGKLVCLQSDAMEPEDARFCRDLFWITLLLRDCYKLGLARAKGD